MGNGFDGLGCTASQGVDIGYIGATHMGQQRRNGRLLWRNGDVDGAALYQINVGGALDEDYGLTGAQLLRQHGRHDVGFIVVGDGDENINLIDMLFQ